MFDNFFNFNPTISQTGSWYLVQGIVYRDLEYDFKSTFGTTVIANKILIKQSTSRFKIHQFFMVEFAYLLDNLINTQNASRQQKYRVNINKYRYLYEEIKKNTWIKTTFNDYSGLYNVDRILNDFKFTPFPDQRAFLDYYSNVKYGFQLKGILLDSKAGTGKAHSLDALILTPDGFKPMREIQLGDKVIGSSGKPVKVTGVYPQGKKQLYHVIFKDGRKEEVCHDHLWTVIYRDETFTLSTKDIIAHRSKWKGNERRLYVPLMEDAYDGNVCPADLPIDPYVMGIIATTGRDMSDGLRIFTAQQEIINRIASAGYKLTRRRSGYTLLIDHPMMDVSISDAYLFSSRKARWALLQGIMDGAGFVNDNGDPILITPSEHVAKQTQLLVRSLGGVCSMKHKDIFYLTMQVNDVHDLFSWPRKRALVQPKVIKGLEIIAITPSRIDEAQCISVDAPNHLYVSTDFIVTHNTYTSLLWSRMLGEGKTIILVLKHLIDEPWLDHLTPKGQRYCFRQPPKVWVSTSDTDPRTSDAEYFIFYKEQLRKDEWNGITFSSIINALSKGGTRPLKMIIDESHNYNDIESQQTQGAVYVGSHPYVTDVLSMSGTPIKSAGKETFPLFKMIDKYFDHEVQKDFIKLYSKNNEALNGLLAHRLGRIKFTINAIDGLGDPPTPIPLKVHFPGVEKYTLKNIRTELIHYIQDRVMYYQKHLPNYLHDFEDYLADYQQRVQDDPTLLSELEKYKETVRYFRKNGFNTFTDSDKSKFCKQVEEKITAHLKGESLHYFRHITPAIKYLPLKIKGEALGNVLGKARINSIKETIEHLNLAQLVKSGIKKTAIYSTYIEAIDAAVMKLLNEGCHPVRYHSQDKASVNEVIKQLRQPNVDCIVTSFDSLSEGQPLLECNQLVMLNLPWREYIIKQTIARIFRKGQDTECFVWSVILDTEGEENITTRTQDIVSFFKEQVDIILGGGLGIDNIEGGSLHLVDHTDYDFNTLMPFVLPDITFRPKFNKSRLTDLFR